MSGHEVWDTEIAKPAISGLPNFPKLIEKSSSDTPSSCRAAYLIDIMPEKGSIINDNSSFYRV